MGKDIFSAGHWLMFLVCPPEPTSLFKQSQICTIVLFSLPAYNYWYSLMKMTTMGFDVVNIKEGTKTVTQDDSQYDRTLRSKKTTFKIPQNHKVVRKLLKVAHPESRICAQR